MNRLTYRGFYTLTDFSSIDNVYYGKIENISDLVTWECDAFNDITSSFHQAVDDYIKV